MSGCNSTRIRVWSGGAYDPVNPAARAALPKVRKLIAAGRFAEAEALANAELMARPLSQMSYQPVGDLLLDMPGLPSVAAFRRELDLDCAMATTTFTAGGVEYRRRAVASPVDQVIAIELTANRNGALNLVVALASPQTSTVEAGGDLLRMKGWAPAENGVKGKLRFSVVARVLPRGGTLTTRGGDLEVRHANAVTILIAAATDYKRFDTAAGDPEQAAAAQIAAASRRSFVQIAESTATAHRRLFRRVALDLGATPAAEMPTDERIRANQAVDDPALAALVLRLWTISADLLFASGQSAGEPAGPVERQHQAALGFEIHHQYQHADELLACGADRA